jgi:integrase
MARLLADPKERHKLTPTNYYYLVKFSGSRSLGYRPRRRGGVWHLKMRIGEVVRSRLIGIADDIEPADGERVLNYSQALKKARHVFTGDTARFFAPERLDLLPHTLRVCPVGTAYTVGHALRDYLEEKRANGSQRGFNSSVADANAYIVGDLTSVPCADLDIKTLKAWFFTLGTLLPDASNFVRRARNQPMIVNDGDADRKAKVRANSVLITLKAALNLAWRDQRIESDASWRRLQPYRGVRKARARILDQAEIAALLDTCPGDLRQLVLASLHTGCRIGELRAMRRSSFNKAAGCLFVHATKTGRSRNIVLSHEAIAFFERMTRGLNENQLVFRTASNLPWTIAGHSARMRKAAAEARLEPPVVFHELRHTYASGLLMAGVSPFVVADQLGHADCTQVIKTYGHVSAAFAIDQIRRLSPQIEVVPTITRKAKRL